MSHPPVITVCVCSLQGLLGSGARRLLLNCRDVKELQGSESCGAQQILFYFLWSWVLKLRESGQSGCQAKTPQR